MERLAGRVAVVTGAASGIGRGVVRRFLREGANVVIGDINEEALAAVADESATQHGEDRVAARQCDVVDEADVVALADLAMDRFGRLDVCVANAGAGGYGLIVDLELAEWRRVTDLCLAGVFLTIKHAGRAMRDAGNGGSIIAIASLNAIQPSAGMSAYCAAKAGVVMLSQCAAMELGPFGIRVNSIGPGLIDTPATGTFFAVPAIVEAFVAATTVGRSGTVEDVAALAAFFSRRTSPGSSRQRSIPLTVAGTRAATRACPRS